jgi:hypothetical protein
MTKTELDKLHDDLAYADLKVIVLRFGLSEAFKTGPTNQKAAAVMKRFIENELDPAVAESSRLNELHDEHCDGPSRRRFVHRRSRINPPSEKKEPTQ